MTEDEIHAAALSDPDNPPMTEEQYQKLRGRPRPDPRVLRRALRFTQEEFAERYQIPVGTIRDWEQRRAKPDAAARAYLRAIAGDPEGVARALKTATTPKAAAE